MVSLSIIEIDNNSSDTRNRRVLCSKEFEWRFILVHGKLAFNLELLEIDTNDESLGLLKVYIELLPKTKKIELLSEKSLEDELSNEKKMKALKIKRFFEYS
jgi:hypothetical protein